MQHDITPRIEEIADPAPLPALKVLAEALLLAACGEALDIALQIAEDRIAASAQQLQEQARWRRKIDDLQKQINEAQERLKAA